MANHRILDNEQLIELRTLAALGVTGQALADHFGVSVSTIRYNQLRYNLPTGLGHVKSNLITKTIRLLTPDQKRQLYSMVKEAVNA